MPQQKVHASDQQILDAAVGERAENVIDVHGRIIPGVPRGVHPAGQPPRRA